MLRPPVLLAFVRRDFLSARSYGIAFVLDVVFGALGLATFFFISRTFRDVSTSELQGAPTYFAFAAVGVALAIVIQATATTLAAQVREEQLTGTLEALAAEPVSTAELSFGLVGYQFLLAVVRGAFLLAIATAILKADLDDANWWAFSLTLVATAALLVSLGTVIGALALLVKRGSAALIGLTTYALAILGGAYFPLAILPDWLLPLAELVPTRFAFDAVRAALLTGEGWARPTVTLVAMTAPILPLGLWLFAAALRLAKRRGSLSQY